MKKEIIRLAARFTKAGRVAAVRSGGWCRTYHAGGTAWKEAVARATAMVNNTTIVTRRGHAGYQEGYTPDGKEFCTGGLGPL